MWPTSGPRHAFNSYSRCLSSTQYENNRCCRRRRRMAGWKTADFKALLARAAAYRYNGTYTREDDTNHPAPAAHPPATCLSRGHAREYRERSPELRPTRVSRRRVRPRRAMVYFIARTPRDVVVIEKGASWTAKILYSSSHCPKVTPSIMYYMRTPTPNTVISW